jgi:hypothetical protein
MRSADASCCEALYLITLRRPFKTLAYSDGLVSKRPGTQEDRLSMGRIGVARAGADCRSAVSVQHEPRSLSTSSDSATQPRRSISRRMETLLREMERRPLGVSWASAELEEKRLEPATQQ